MQNIITFLVSTLFLISCSSTNEKEKTKIISKDTLTVIEVFEKGKTLENIACKNNPNNSFALYLPSTYTINKNYPIIIAIDPHAKGIEPVEKYKKLAEKFNFIIVGSNNSENGKSWEEVNQTISNLLTEAKSRLAINTNRIYLLGFSGGARIANAIVMTNGQIEAAICCGGAAPAINEPIQRTNYSLVLLIGNHDFNYTEVCKYDKVELNNIKHTLIKFDGGHEWPNEEAMEDAFNFLELNEMRRTITYKKDAIINPVIENEEKKLSTLLSENKTVEAYLKCKKVISYYNGLNDLKYFYSTFQTFKVNSEIDEYLRLEEAWWKLEEEEKQKYMKALQNNDINWWNKNISELNKKIKIGKKTEEVNMQKRLLSYLSITCYMQTTNALKQNNLNSAEYFSNIYILVDPTNYEAHYLNAMINSVKGKSELALKSFEKAIQNGFNDTTRLKADEKHFVSLNKYKYFDELKQSMIKD